MTDSNAPIYLDYNATTPIDPRVAQSMLPYLGERFGNPSSAHWLGVEASQAVAGARRQVADLLGCEPDEILFTSGGSESNNLALKGLARARRHHGDHLITSAIEHPAVGEVCRHLETEGFRVTYLPVDAHGRVDPEAVAQAITPRTLLISIMHANNEVGTLQPIAEIVEIARRHGVPVHTDAAQSVGKVPTRVDTLGVDLLSIAGHKLYAPKGIGALYVRRGLTLQKLMHGADHERNRRAGTENVLEIVGLGSACALAGEDLPGHARHMQAMRDRLHERLAAGWADLRLNGHPDERLPNTLSVCFRNVEATAMLTTMDRIAASAGAACHTDAIDVSHVLTAMGVPTDYAMGTLRFSTGMATTEAQIDQAAVRILDAAHRLQPQEGPNPPPPTPTGEIRLTQYAQGLGCACKLRPQILEQLLAGLPTPKDPAVLVGSATADDAAVYRLDAETAIVESVDFFAPIVDDPYTFGAIAATNAISDIYAMGATPRFALSIVGFPHKRLPLSALQQILEGASAKADEAGVSIVGGHSIEAAEPLYGMVVTGLAHPERILTNAGAQPGDALIVTKPIGTGIITAAQKLGLATPAAVEQAVAVMTRLNRAAAEVIVEHPVNACTDVTGFGLLGHLQEMVRASRVAAEIDFKAVPLIEAAWSLIATDDSGRLVSGGTRNNRENVAERVRWSDRLPEAARIILCDAQTSGGLLIATPQAAAPELVAALRENGVPAAALIGRCVAADRPVIRIGGF